MSAIDYTVNWSAVLNPHYEVLSGASFDDVLLLPQKTSLKTRADADISVDFLGRKLEVPFLSAPMPTVTGPDLANRLDKLGGLAVLHRFCSIEEQLFAEAASGVFPAISIGIHDGIERTKKFIVHTDADIFVLDVAHAHSDPVIDFIKLWKKEFPHEILVVGNVATGNAASDLINAGADAIKVGIGPGSVCTTRQVTGFGVPQLQAINHVKVWTLSQAVPIIADGGIRNSGDVVKALAAGADVVMIGKLFAHAEEAPNVGNHYGCASSFVTDNNVEGTFLEIGAHEKEPLEDIVNRLAAGLRSGISYGGATSIAELRQKASWIRITDAGRRESKL